MQLGLDSFIEIIFEGEINLERNAKRNTGDELNSIHGNRYILVNRVEFVCSMLKLEANDSRKDLATKVFERGTKSEIKNRKVFTYIPITVSEYKKIFKNFDEKPSWKKRQ